MLLQIRGEPNWAALCVRRGTVYRLPCIWSAPGVLYHEFGAPRAGFTMHSEQTGWGLPCVWSSPGKAHHAFGAAQAGLALPPLPLQMQGEPSMVCSKCEVNPAWSAPNAR